MTCVECGVEMGAARVCHRCGAPVLARPAVQAQGRQPVRRVPLKLVRVIVALVIVIANGVVAAAVIDAVVIYVTHGSTTQVGVNYEPLGVLILGSAIVSIVPGTTIVLSARYLRREARKRRAAALDSPALVRRG